MSPYLTFLLSAVVVVAAGIRLAQDGDRIAGRLHRSRGFIGPPLVAGIHLGALLAVRGVTG